MRSFTLARTVAFNRAALALSLMTVGASPALGACRFDTHMATGFGDSGQMSEAQCRQSCNSYATSYGGAPAICSYAPPGSDDFRQVEVYRDPNKCVSGLTRNLMNFQYLPLLEQVRFATHGNSYAKGLPWWANVNGCLSGQEPQIWELRVSMSGEGGQIILSRLNSAPTKLPRTVKADQLLAGVNQDQVEHCRMRLSGYPVSAEACPEEVFQMLRYATGPNIGGWGMPQIFQEVGNLSFRDYQLQLLSELTVAGSRMEFSLVEPWSYMPGNQAYGTSGAYLSSKRRRVEAGLLPLVR